MVSIQKTKVLYIALLFILGLTTSFAQTLVLSDPLTGSTKGQRYGGTLTSSGYQPGTGENHILYKLNQIPNGYVEFEVTGFKPSSLPAGADHAFLVMYDGRGVNEPANYFNNFKFNFFRWNFHWRQNRSAFKSVVNLASPSTSNNSNIGYWRQIGDDDPRDFATEPTGTGFSWNSSSWTKIKIEWRNKQFKAYANGQLVWSSSGPYDYAPKDFRIWLGSGPGKYNSETSGQTFRNFKVYTYGGGVTPVDELSISPSSQNVSSSSGNTNISVSSNVSWSASDNASWLTLSPSSGSNNGSISATFQENTNSSSRTATVSVSGSGITRTATITQSGKSSSGNSLSLSPSSQNVSSASGNTNISVSSNISWSASDNASWLTLSPSSGSYNSSISATFQENTNSSSRTATVSVSGSGITRTATITQNGTNPPPTGDKLTVLSPSSGQILVPGNSHQITWSGPSSVADVGLYFSSNSGEDWSQIASSTTNDGNFTWTVPNVISNRCIVRVKDTRDWSNYDRSDIFRIAKDGDPPPPPPPTGDKLTVLSPSSGQILVPGSSHQITWSGPSSVADVGLYFSSNSGEDWSQIASSTTNDGNFTWTVPNVISNRCIVRVKDTRDWSNYDRSDIFKIVRSSGLAKGSANENSLESNLPEEFALLQNYPNPFNPTTNIQFALPNSQRVKITIFNMMGEEVKLLLDRELSAGVHDVNFDASNLTSGVYIYRVVAGDFVAVKRMTLLK